MARYTKERLLSGMAGWHRSQRCRNSSGSFAKLTATRPADWAFPRSPWAGRAGNSIKALQVGQLHSLGLSAISMQSTSMPQRVVGFDYVLP